MDGSHMFDYNHCHRSAFIERKCNFRLALMYYKSFLFPLKGYVRQAYKNFMIGNIESRKVRRENIVQWIEIGLEKVKVETITRTWAKVGIEIFTTAV